MTRDEAIEILESVSFFAPSDIDVDTAIDMAIEALERKKGEWIERSITHDRRDAKIPEWQSAKCSVCGKYHTTPFLYNVKWYNYCPNCGARMDEGREDDKGRNTTSV